MGRDVKLLCTLLITVLVIAIGGCGNRPDAAVPPPLPTAAPAPLPTPTPVLALGQRRQGIIFHDLTHSEQVCPGLAEILGPNDVSPEQISDSAMEVVRQVRLVCTNEDRGTVYFIDLDNQTITVTRKPPPIPGMP